MGEIKYVGSIVMIVLFSIAIISFALNFAIDNNADISLSDDSSFSNLDTSLRNNVSQFNVDANSTGDTFRQSEAKSGDQVTESGGQFKVGIFTLIGMLPAIYSIVKIQIFGGSNSFGIVLVALSSFLAFVGFRYAYKSWFGRNPD
ncbi:hypothetical protein CMI47_14080 [Candidatus Pacearchaeota archaeon]|jgi:hypothetical protein|nr:hypothetical protein [Candidatus Pacearchaeota archaeon]|tara:strand:+ start:15427 stop:15861 length:435 start_codon:yes stop_codon:yes gene_type:complete